MKTIDSLGLQTVSSIIADCISTSSIYCFGEKKQFHAVENPFQECASGEKQNTHYYLLILTDEYISNAVADISDIIKNKTEGRFTATLLFYKTKFRHSLTHNQLYFYYQVVTRGNKVYERENSPLNISFDGIPEFKIERIKSYWKNRNLIAETYLDSVGNVDYTSTGFVQESMLHIAVEQICLGLISVFLGYYPDHFSLLYLFEICEIFTPLTSDIFPRSTSEDKAMLELLKVNPASLRWSKVQESCLVSTQLLEKRCGLFYEKATEIAEAELLRQESLCVLES
ncbi:hypothetical protein BSF41_45220 [Flavobacterium sp. ACN2]|uniref:hypothetical protein n=1 Tax=Flavobacterium sp. ACN2 TaxID=1975676 RepID=UPI000BB3B631|nr:hypothetical protein [Flavobacterium sp. ACN2]PBI83536.1 hypothetical protein BSF41_45220 [Flavobacterium sp. ACN2]